MLSTAVGIAAFAATTVAVFAANFPDGPTAGGLGFSACEQPHGAGEETAKETATGAALDERARQGVKPGSVPRVFFRKTYERRLGETTDENA